MATCTGVLWKWGLPLVEPGAEAGSQDANPWPEGHLPGDMLSLSVSKAQRQVWEMSSKVEASAGSGHLSSHKPPHSQVPAQE